MLDYSKNCEPVTSNSLSPPDITLRSMLIKIGLLFSLFALIFLLAYLNWILPWWLLVILALPIYLALEKFGGVIFSDKPGWNTQQVGFSPLRILVGVSFVLVVSFSAYILFR